MKIKTHDIISTLEKKPVNLFILQGEDGILIKENLEIIYQSAKNNNFTAFIKLSIDKNFEWPKFLSSLKQISLFAEKTVYIMQFENPKLSKDEQAIVSSFSEFTRDDQWFIFIFPKLEAAQQKTKWFTTLENKALWIQLWPLQGSQLAQWVKTKLAEKKLSTSPQGLQLLLELNENNLQSLDQAIEKLSLQFPSGAQIEESELAKSLSNQSNFTLFDFADSLLQGQAKKTMKIFQYLKEEGTEAILILWAIAKEIRLLIKLGELKKQGLLAESSFQKNGIWPKRAVYYQQALARKKPEQLMRLLPQLSRLDIMMKSESSPLLWSLLLKLALQV